MKITEQMTIGEKLHILTDAAKYDVACTSSGNGRRGGRERHGKLCGAGICHSFSADGKVYFPSENSAYQRVRF